MRTLVSVVIFSMLSFAQSAPTSSTQADAASGQSSSGSSSSQSAGAAKSPPTTPDRANAQTTVPADIKEVRRNLEALKSAVNKMDEGPAHDAAEQNVKFLESLVSYLEHEKSASSANTSSPPRSRHSQTTKTGAPTGVAGENPK